MSAADGLGVRVIMCWLGDRLVVRRRVEDSRAALTEYWFSDPVSEREVFRFRLHRPRPGWSRLGRGLWVDELEGPVPLRPLAADDLDAAALARQRPLLALTAGLRRAGRPVVDTADIEVTVSDPLATAVRSVFDPILAELRSGPAAAEQDRSRPPARIELDDVRGAQVGERTIQVNRFVAVAGPMQVDFDEALRRAEPALQQLRQDPGNRSLRAAAVAAMRQGGLDVLSRPASLRVPTDGGESLLDGLKHVIGIRVGSGGVQVGDGGVQRNEFRYLVTAPSGDEVIRAHPALGRALVDCVCPTTESQRDVLTLSRDVERAVRDMPVRYTGSRAQHVRLAPPAPGDVLTIGRVDGVHVGRTGVQQRIDMTDISTVAVERRRIEAARVAALEEERQREIEALRVQRQREIEALRLQRQREIEALRVQRQREITLRGPSIGRL